MNLSYGGAILGSTPSFCLYFKRNRSTYYHLLNDIRHTGDWEAWLGFFLEGVGEVAEAAFATARSVSETIREDRARIGRLGWRAGSALRVHQSLVERPIGGIRHLRREPASPRRPWLPCSGFLKNSPSCARSRAASVAGSTRMSGIWPFCGRGRSTRLGRGQPIGPRTISFASRPTAASACRKRGRTLVVSSGTGPQGNRPARR